MNRQKKGQSTPSSASVAERPKHAFQCLWHGGGLPHIYSVYRYDLSILGVTCSQQNVHRKMFTANVHGKMFTAKCGQQNVHGKSSQ